MRDEIDARIWSLHHDEFARLVDQVVAWDAAGRPATSRLHIRAYPRDCDYTPSPTEVVIPKRWTQLVLSWTKPLAD